MNTPSITRRGVFDCQVCVPKTYSDGQAMKFISDVNPCGTSGGWHMRKNGDELLRGDKERTPCEEREDYVHIMFDA